MKHIKTFENIIKPEIILFRAIREHKNEILKELIDNISDINYQRPLDGLTFLMVAAIADNTVAFDLLVKARADWNIEQMDGWNVLELIEPKEAKKIIDKYPEEYKLYLAKKDAQKYNL